MPRSAAGVSGEAAAPVGTNRKHLASSGDVSKGKRSNTRQRKSDADDGGMLAKYVWDPDVVDSEESSATAGRDLAPLVPGGEKRGKSTGGERRGRTNGESEKRGGGSERPSSSSSSSSYRHSKELSRRYRGAALGDGVAEPDAAGNQAEELEPDAIEGGVTKLITEIATATIVAASGMSDTRGGNAANGAVASAPEPVSDGPRGTGAEVEVEAAAGAEAGTAARAHTAAEVTAATAVDATTVQVVPDTSKLGKRHVFTKFADLTSSAASAASAVPAVSARSEMDDYEALGDKVDLYDDDGANATAITEEAASPAGVSEEKGLRARLQHVKSRDSGTKRQQKLKMEEKQPTLISHPNGGVSVGGSKKRSSLPPSSLHASSDDSKGTAESGHSQAGSLPSWEEERLQMQEEQATLEKVSRAAALAKQLSSAKSSSAKRFSASNWNDGVHDDLGRHQEYDLYDYLGRPAGESKDGDADTSEDADALGNDNNVDDGGDKAEEEQVRSSRKQTEETTSTHTVAKHTKVVASVLTKPTEKAIAAAADISNASGHKTNASKTNIRSVVETGASNSTNHDTPASRTYQSTQTRVATPGEERDISISSTSTSVEEKSDSARDEVFKHAMTKSATGGAAATSIAASLADANTTIAITTSAGQTQSFTVGELGFDDSHEDLIDGDKVHDFVQGGREYFQKMVKTGSEWAQTSFEATSNVTASAKQNVDRFVGEIEDQSRSTTPIRVEMFIDTADPYSLELILGPVQQLLKMDLGPLEWHLSPHSDIGQERSKRVNCKLGAHAARMSCVANSVVACSSHSFAAMKPGLGHRQSNPTAASNRTTPANHSHSSSHPTLNPSKNSASDLPSSHPRPPRPNRPPRPPRPPSPPSTAHTPTANPVSAQMQFVKCFATKLLVLESTSALKFNNRREDSLHKFSDDCCHTAMKSVAPGSGDGINVTACNIQEQCVQSNHGFELMAQTSDALSQLKPRHKWLPWVLVEGSPVCMHKCNLQKGIRRAVCNHREGTLPHDCPEFPWANIWYDEPEVSFVGVIGVVIGLILTTGSMALLAQQAGCCGGRPSQQTQGEVEPLLGNSDASATAS